MSFKDKLFMLCGRFVRDGNDKASVVASVVATSNTIEGTFPFGEKVFRWRPTRFEFEILVTFRPGSFRADWPRKRCARVTVIFLFVSRRAGTTTNFSSIICAKYFHVFVTDGAEFWFLSRSVSIRFSVSRRSYREDHRESAETVDRVNELTILR